MTFTSNSHNSERLIPAPTEPARKHWLMFATHQMQMAQIENGTADAAEWFAQYEDADALIFDADTALDLAMTAPSDYAAGLLMGRALLLKELAALGRPTAATETA